MTGSGIFWLAFSSSALGSGLVIAATIAILYLMPDKKDY